MARFTLPRWITWDREGLNAEQIPNSPLRYRFTKDFRGAREWPYDSVLFFVAQYQGKYREAVRTSDGLMYVVQLPNGTYEPRRGALPRATVTLPATSTTSSVSGDVLAIQRRLNQLPSSLARLVEDGKWGARTMARVQEFQRSVGLSPDGQVGATTRAALFGNGSQPAADNTNAQPPPKKNMSRWLFYGVGAVVVLMFIGRD